jgi:hypothetical protein
MIHDCGHSNVQTSTFNVATLAIGPFLIYFKMVLLISTVYRCLGLSGRLPAEPHPPHLWDAFFVINSSIPSFPSSSHYYAAACAPDIVSAFQMCWIYSTTADDELHVLEEHPFRVSLLCYFWGLNTLLLFGFESCHDLCWLWGSSLLD